MLDLRVSHDVRPLASELARLLAQPLSDPMASEWVAVPTEGMARWLRLELARTLGSSGNGSGDGVCANITFTSPGALRDVVLACASSARARDRPSGPWRLSDPWYVDHLVWAVLEALRAGASDERLGPVRLLQAGATWYGRARRVADLFDRYAARRPDLLRHWSAGRDLDAAGRAIAAGDAWQPHLWRLVRSRIGAPSPAEELPGLLAAVRSGDADPALPARIAVFGITTLPGGRPFLDLVDAVAARRDVHCYLLDASPVATSRVRALARATASDELCRGDDISDQVVRHPLLRSWGRPYRERAVLLAAAEGRGLAAVAEDAGPPPGAGAQTLLQRVQRDLRLDVVPDASFELGPDDRSVTLCSCHGVTRQVEVVRDAILHLLADDPTLEERDVVVLCPAIAELAPVVEAVFGTTAGGPAPSRDGVRPASRRRPALSYRIADRSIRDSYPVLAALDALLALAAGRFPASAVTEFLGLGPVRERFGLDDRGLETIGQWIVDANVRWGIDGAHRERWGLPRELAACTWRTAVDRVLMGVAVGERDLELAAGEIAPIPVESGDIGLAGLLAEVLARLVELVADVTRPKTPREWSTTLASAADRFLSAPTDQRWQLDRLHEVVTGLGAGATVGARDAEVELTLADVRRLLADWLAGSPRRPDFFRGGVTVSSLAPLRGLPFRVVCILGLDDAATDGAAGDGDDLTAAAPRLGDRDPRSEARQALLEAVLAAGDHLVVTRTGHDDRTNQPVPPSVAYAELRDTVAATLAARPGASVLHRVEVVHPRHAFDERCLEPGALGTAGPWSFDPEALDAALARRSRRDEPAPFLAAPLPPRRDDDCVVTIAELAAFLRDPAGAFFRERLGVALPRQEAPARDDLVTALAGLDRWRVAERLIVARCAGWTTDRWVRYERGLGTLPPGGLGDLAVAQIVTEVEDLLDTAATLGCGTSDAPVRTVDVAVELGNGARVVGSVYDGGDGERPGTARVTYSRARPLHHLEAWLELAARVACDPETSWRSTVVRRAASGTAVDALVLEPVGATPADRRRAAVRGLEVAVDCYRRALREPVPLFPTLSRSLYDGTASATKWRSREGLGDGDGEYVLIAHGSTTIEELLAIPARPDDPSGVAAGRADRYAHYLWEAVDASARPVPGSPGPRSRSSRPGRGAKSGR